MNKPQFFTKNINTLMLMGLILIEYLLFRTYVLRDIVPFYPVNNDQAHYLSYSYEIYDLILHYGLLEGLSRANIFTTDVFLVDGRSASNLLFAPQAAIFYLFSSASRLSALTINFIYFSVLQIVSYRVVSRLTQNSLYGLMFVGLILMLHTPFFWAGGLFDFRLDFAVACTYGIFMAIVVRSNIFLNVKWGLLATMIAIYLILLRYFTVVYLGCIYVGLFFYYFVQWKAAVNLDTIRDAKKRIKNLLCLGVGAGLVLGPVFWAARHAIYSYYIVGHVMGSEKNVRAKELGVEDFISKILFYPKSFLVDHFGQWLTVILIVIILLACGQSFYKKHFPSLKYDKNTLYFIFLSILIPVMVLSINQIKSEVVMGIICLPVIWLIFILGVQLKNRAMKLCLYGIFFAGSLSFLAHFTHDPIANQSSKEVVHMYKDLANYINESEVPIVNFAADNVLDSSPPQVFQIIAYENLGLMPEILKTRLSNNIFEISKEDALEAFNHSDIFIVNPQGNYAASPYPFYESMKKIRPELLALARKNWVLLGDYAYGGYAMQAYVKPSFAVKSFGTVDAGDRGLYITLPSMLVNKVNKLSIAGECIDCVEQAAISLSTHILNATHTQRSIQSTLEIKNGQYSVTLDLPSDLPDNQPLRIAVQLFQNSGSAMRSIRMSLPETKVVAMNPHQGESHE